MAGRNKKENTAEEKKRRTSAGKTSLRSRSKSEPAGSAEKRAQIQEEMRRAHASRRIRDVISGLIYIAIGLFIFASVQFHTAGDYPEGNFRCDRTGTPVVSGASWSSVRNREGASFYAAVALADLRDTSGHVRHERGQVHYGRGICGKQHSD